MSGIPPIPDLAYVKRSLRHERKMMRAYRERIATDAGVAGLRAGACARAAAFEWALAADPQSCQALWSEAAGALADAAERETPGARRLIHGLHLAIASRNGEAFRRQAYAASHTSQHTPDLQNRPHAHLLEGYAMLAVSLLERNYAPARAASQALGAALSVSDRQWWRRKAPSLSEAAWLMAEHRAVCTLLRAVADTLARGDTSGNSPYDNVMEATPWQLAARFALATDEALLRLDRFLRVATSHQPGLYVWLPGLAIVTLGASAGLPMRWLRERYQNAAPGYERLPLELLPALDISS
ncbi:MAG: hypothetical protein ACKV2V_13665 [Blastocatellia bacterium]